MIRLRGVRQLLIALVLSGLPLFSNGEAVAEGDLFDIGLEQLVKIKVTSVSKTDQNALDAPAAVYVLTNNDIKRSGATTIPDALRLVPGLQVAQVGATGWAVNARGPASIFANKLLVLIDGRSVYTPSFGGVYWDEQQVMLEDVERIEIIRGPGASVWGANAVNGVINIITKNSKDTQGGLLVGGGGSNEHGFARIRQGGEISDTSTFRVWSMYNKKGGLEFEQGGDAGDAWESGQVGFRTDSKLDDGGTLAISGAVFKQSSSEATLIQVPTPPFSVSFNDSTSILNTHLLGKYERSIDADSQLGLQLYYDHVRRDRTIVLERRDTFDADFNYQTKLNDSNLLSWGAHYRVFFDRLGSEVFSVEPEHAQVSLVDTFIQNDHSFDGGRGHFVLGTKLEYNDFTGVEVQPTARLSYKPAENKVVWSAVSRAVHTPTRVADGVDLLLGIFPVPGSPVPVESRLTGTKDVESEDMYSYEVGYRYEPSSAVCFDLSVFYNYYRDLSGVDGTGGEFDPSRGTIVVPGYVESVGKGRGYGTEFSSRIRAYEDWEIVAGYGYLNFDTAFPDAFTPFEDSESSALARNRFFVRSSYQPFNDLTFDTILRYVSGMGFYKVDDYFGLDQQISYRLTSAVTVSLVGRNLLDSGNVELSPQFFAAGREEVPRSVYGKVEFRF